MLPRIELPLGSFCTIGRHADGSLHPCGTAYAFDWSVLEDAACEAGENLDTLLTRHVLQGLDANGVRTDALFWYAPLQGAILLAASDAGGQEQYAWLRDLPGYLRSDLDEQPFRRSILPHHSRPFLCVSNRRLHEGRGGAGSWRYRLHACPSTFNPVAYYVEDWGAFSGLSAAPVDAETYRRIERAPRSHFDYSAVPRSNPDPDAVGGCLHVWYSPAR